MKNGFFSRFVLLATWALLSVSPVTYAQSPVDNGSEAIRLKAENEKLRAENQRLRQLATQGQPAPKAPLAQAPVVPVGPFTPRATPSPAVDTAGLTHWITSSSSKRHNSGCRWYGTSAGRKCSATEGIACLKCGG